ncbi:cupin domain-containing protein [Variovorax ginsengisoli]|uniref:Cupin domain-containing protein n=1 Tax=Variovorax ginsengisoli TaxID=363844 RepID=A0ABT8S665_9BURK|nr:cupin domain-containing protein [Variovorax ginsengisoli]MDN8615244.1 cupin domain-containing protein [Variovorax ginsengisoli]MDO1534414.1 cupin domain-containing protein [Variovorax ginsengisoli]
MKATRIMAAAMLIAGGGLMGHLAQAQSAGLGRTDVLQHDLGIAGREVVQARVDFAPGVMAPRHSHPGVEVAYVIEGMIEYQIDGNAPVTLKAGDGLYIPDGAVHSARNIGGGKASELATYFVEKGKPVFVPAK